MSPRDGNLLALNETHPFLPLSLSLSDAQKRPSLKRETLLASADAEGCGEMWFRTGKFGSVLGMFTESKSKIDDCKSVNCVFNDFFAFKFICVNTVHDRCFIPFWVWWTTF